MNSSLFSLLSGRRPDFSRGAAPVSLSVNPRRGFTLIEMLAVTAIIAILIGFVGGAAYSARQRAYNAQANAEAQAIATAFKSYWLANGKWPAGFKSGENELDESNLKELIGDNGDGSLPYLEVPPERFQDDGSGSKKYLDPWGHPYIVSFEQIQEPQTTSVYEGACSFPNVYRSYYEDGAYTQRASDWQWRP